MHEPTPPPLPPELPGEVPRGTPRETPPGDLPPPSWAPPAPALAYSVPTTQTPTARPTLVTALGVSSIVFAVLGAAGAVLTAVAAFVFYARAQAIGAATFAERAAASADAAAAAARPSPPRLPPEVGPGGLADPLRRGVVDAFNRVRRLRPARLEQLDAILARHGKVIVQTPADRQAGVDPSPGDVRAIVNDHGELFSGNRAAAPDFFRLTTGRLELYDDRAVFYPADGSATIRSAHGRPPARRALAAGEVAAVVSRAKTLGRGVLTDAQASALAAALSSPDQKLIATAPAAPTAASEPQSVVAGAGGGVTIRFAEGPLHLGPMGEILPGPTGPPPAPRPSTAAFLAVVAASLVGLALSGVLFVAALQLLRGLHAGRRLHVTWAWLMIPVVATTAVAFWWMTSQFNGAMHAYDAASFGRRTAGLLARIGLPVAGLAFVYPVSVLALLRARTVREYFGTGT